MTVEQQRYCPLCDKLLIAGEAVLQCSKCQRMHHPACWVKNQGCSLMCADAVPVPVAYQQPAPGYQPSHPAEGTRSAASPPPPRGLEAPRDPVERVEPVARSGGYPNPVREPAPAPRPLPTGATPAAETMIGQARPNAAAPSREPTAPMVIEPPPRANRGRYTGSGDGKHPPVEDMKLYRDNSILRFWYIPVAGLLAIAVAIGVIFAADRLFGGGDDTAAVPGDETPTPGASESPTPGTGTATPTVDADSTPDGDETPAPTTGPTESVPPPPGELAIGASVVIANTGECLNIRRAAGTDGEIVACLSDGTPMTITGGPQEANDLVWWQLSNDDATGWGAASYLSPASPQ